MVKKQNVSKAEAARRAAQASKDKKASRSTRFSSTMVKQPTKKSKGSSGPPPYAGLVLDPCNARFTQSSLPGAGGSTCVRCPFRQVVYAQKSGVDIFGNADATVTSSRDTIGALLTPHCMINGNGTPGAVSIYGANSEAQTFLIAGGNSADPQGLLGLSSYVGEMRPVAACIRITCMGSDLENTGMFFGYEGTAKQYIRHTTVSDMATAFIPNTSAQNFIFNGRTSGDTYKTFEAMVNYPCADEDWQDFRSLTVNAAQSGANFSVTRSPDGTDPDFSQMPIAFVGVTSATPGCRYLIDGAIVYEWFPKAFVGLSAPPRTTISATNLGVVAKYVQSVASKYGGMLVGAAANYVTAGNANQVLGLLRSAYAARNAGPARIGW